MAVAIAFAEAGPAGRAVLQGVVARLPAAVNSLSPPQCMVSMVRCVFPHACMHAWVGIGWYQMTSSDNSNKIVLAPAWLDALLAATCLIPFMHPSLFS